MKQFTILAICVMYFSTCASQVITRKALNQEEAAQCDCLKNWHWLKETFENNDAGFQWAIDRKGMETYQQFCDSIEVELRKASDIYECEKIIKDWGKFFRKGHFFVALNQFTPVENAPVNTETVEYSIETVKAQIQELKDTLIGIWHSHPYTIGIVRDTINLNRKYVGFIIKSEVEEWKPGEVKVEFFEAHPQLSANLYLRDHSLWKTNARLISDAELIIGNSKFLNTLKIDTLEQRLLSTSSPLFLHLSDETALLRIPSFSYNKTDEINTLIKRNEKSILSHKNLIIDLRGNEGGSDYSWREIIPFIYTNPIETIGVEFYSTPLNRSLHYDDLPFFRRIIAHKHIKKAKKNDGKFVARNSFSIQKLKTIHPKPQKVMVLVDEDCASSTEQFIFAAKQSTKTTIYGKQTFGALDVSNMVRVFTPDNCFLMSYSVTRTLRPAAARIDDIGIVPDVSIPDYIPKYKWIDFVVESLKSD